VSYRFYFEITTFNQLENKAAYCLAEIKSRKMQWKRYQVFFCKYPQVQQKQSHADT
jgi:hypothetical protein